MDTLSYASPADPATATAPTPSPTSLRALDWLNVFLADVRDGVGPYLAIYLLSVQHWDPAKIGVAMAVSGFATVAAQTPAGWLVDRSRAKRGWVVAACAAIAVGCLAMITWPTLSVVVGSQVLVGIGAAIITPAVAAITLGLVGHHRLERRMGRNEAWNHAGNVAAAALAGALGTWFGPQWIFYLVAAMSVAGVTATLRVRAGEIDHDLARGAADDERPAGGDPAGTGATAGQAGNGQAVSGVAVSGVAALLADKRIVWFAVAVVLFHFANAAMLPLVGQLLTVSGKEGSASAYMSACIIIAQAIMVPVAAWSGRAAKSWGRRPIFLAALAVLPIRGVLYTLSHNAYYLVAVQALDGIGAGVFGVVSVIVIADLTRGTGRFNLTQGAILTAVGIGASLSNLIAGAIVERAGYDAAFLFLAAAAVLAVVAFYARVPETLNAASPAEGGRGDGDVGAGPAAAVPVA